MKKSWTIITKADMRINMDTVEWYEAHYGDQHSGVLFIRFTDGTLNDYHYEDKQRLRADMEKMDRITQGLA